MTCEPAEESRQAAARGGFIVKELPERELSRTEIAVSVADHVCPCDFPKLLGHLERHPRSFGLAFSALGGKPVKAAVCTELLKTRHDQNRNAVSAWQGS